MKRGFKLSSFTIIVLLVLFKFTPVTHAAGAAALCQHGIWNDGTDIDFTGTGTYLGTFDCGSPANMCAGADGNPHPANASNPKAWMFYYSPTCDKVTFNCSYLQWLNNECTGTATCTWNTTDCSAVDRCDTGYASGSDYKVYAGQCNASSYNGSDPQTACTTGGWYKSCCTGQETSATSPLGHCNVIPYTRTCDRGSPTSASVITCPVTIPTCNDDIACTPDTCDGSAHPNTCYEGNGIKTNCEYTTFTSGSTVKSANCTRVRAENQSCNIDCDPNSSLPTCSDGQCIGSICSITNTTPTQTSTTIILTRPQGCTDTPTWSGDIPGISGTSYNATGLTPGQSYTVTASVCNVSCSKSFNTVTPTPS